MLCGGDYSHRKTRESAVSFAVLPDKGETFALRVGAFLFLFLNVQHGQYAVGGAEAYFHTGEAEAVNALRIVLI